MSASTRPSIDQVKLLPPPSSSAVQHWSESYFGLSGGENLSEAAKTFQVLSELPKQQQQQDGRSQGGEQKILTAEKKKEERASVRDKNNFFSSCSGLRLQPSR